MFFLSRKWKNRLLLGINLLVALTMIVGCAAPAVSTSNTTQVETHPEPEEVAPSKSTPRPDFLPVDAELVPTPVAAPMPPGSEIYRTYSGPSFEEILHRQQTQGYVECPEEQVLLLEEGVAFICPGVGADMPVVLAVFAPAGVMAFADTPAPGPVDALAVVYVLVSGALVLTTGYALSQMPRVLMARNPNLLPDVVVPPGIPAPPTHLGNHPRGEFVSKLKMLGWVSIMASWLASETGGPKPDWCGTREDGAILVAYFGMQILTTTGRVYQGIAAVVNTGGAHLSTILTGIKPPTEAGGLPDSGNSSGNDFSQFAPLPPEQCPPMPRIVTQ